PLRIWVAGCSSGEETYSLAMLFGEQIDASKREIKLQIFATDVDPDAVASAREGLYPDSIEADVSTKRLAQFFNRLRITAQLVEAATGAHLWADKFDGAVADVFDLQDQ